MNEIFINWVNSIEYPNCLLATSIQDFYSGVVFCEIINEKILQNQRPDFLPKIRNHNPSYYDSIYNMEMALQALTSQKAVLNIPPEIEQLKSQEVVKDDAKIIMLMKFLYNLSNPSYTELAHSNQTENFATVNNNHLYEFDSASSKNFATNLLENQYYSTVTSQPDKILAKKPPVNPHSNNFRSLKNPPPSSFKQQQQQQQPIQSYNTVGTGNSLNSLKPISTTSDFGNIKSHQQQQNTLKTETINFDQKENSLPSEFASLNNLKMIQSPTSVSSIACVQDLNQSKGMMSDFNFLQSPKPSLPCLNKLSGFNSNASSPANSKKNQDYSGRDSIVMSDKEKGPVEIHYLTSWATEQDPKFEDGSKKQVYTIENEIENTPYFKHRASSGSLNRLDAEERHYKLEGKFRLDSHPDDGPYEIPPRKMTKSASVGNRLHKSPKNSTEPAKNNSQEITGISQEAKNQLLVWLKSMKVLKGNFELFDGQLSKNCKNGYIIAELINRIEKKDVLKGIIQNTEIKLNMKSNFQKIMAFLRKCRDMNPRFFTAQDQIINGNENIFWGLLSDIYRFYNKKPLTSNSPSKQNHWPIKNLSDRKSTHQNETPRNRRNSMESNLFDFSDTASFINTLRKGSPDSPLDRQENYSLRQQNEIPKIMIERVSIENQSKRYESPNPVKRRLDGSGGDLNNNSTPRRPSQRNSYTSLHHTRQNSNAAYSHRGTPRDSSAKKRTSARRDTDRQWLSPRGESTSRDVKNSQQNHQETVEECGWTIEIEHRIAEWLKELGFSGFNLKGGENSSLFNDSLRNGTLFGQLIEKVLQEKMNRLYLTPKSIDECRCNIYSVFNAINKRSIPLPIFLKGKQEAVLKGNRNVIFGLLQALKQFYDSKHSPELNFMSDKNSCEVGGSTLPYSEQEIQLLESSILHWLYSLHVPSVMRIGIRNFTSLIANLKSGLILCELISIITKEKYVPRHARPTSESQCLANIQKCLEDLRKREWMGQRYLWKEKEVFDGNKFVLIGLLEDLRRFHDGLPPRMPPNYFADGPYLPDSDKKNYQSIDLRKPVDDLMFETIENNMNTQNLFSTETINRHSFSGFASRDHHHNQTNASESKSNMPPSSATINSRYYSTTQRNSSIPRPPSASGSATKKGGMSHRGLSDYQTILKNNFSSLEKSSRENPRISSARKYLENSTRSRSGSASKENNTTESKNSNTFSQGFYRNLVNRSRPPSVSNRPQVQNTKELVMEYKLKQWLISLEVQGLPRDSNFELTDLPRLSDGIILVKILEKLERKKMHNITMNPTSKRDCITNIKMCLKNLILNSKIRGFDSKFEEKLIRGDINAFKELFLTLMEIYP